MLGMWVVLPSFITSTMPSAPSVTSRLSTLSRASTWGSAFPFCRSTAAPSADSSSRRLGLNTVAPAYSKNWRNFGSTTTGMPRRRATSITAWMTAGDRAPLL